MALSGCRPDSRRASRRAPARRCIRRIGVSRGSRTGIATPSRSRPGKHQGQTPKSTPGENGLDGWHGSERILPIASHHYRATSGDTMRGIQGHGRSVLIRVIRPIRCWVVALASGSSRYRDQPPRADASRRCPHAVTSDDDGLHAHPHGCFRALARHSSQTYAFRDAAPATSSECPFQ